MATKTVSRVRAAAREARAVPPARSTLDDNKTSPFNAGARRTLDGISNAVARLGIGEANQASFGSYNFNPITRLRIILDWAYRGSWLARMAVDAIPEDMTREGIELGSELDAAAKSDLLAACSDEYQLWDRICDGLKWGRLYGGAILYIMVDGQDPSTPLRIDTIGKNGLQNFMVMDRWMLDPALNDLVRDPRSADIGLPKYYTVVSDSPVQARQKIHHTRCIRFEGDDVPYYQRLAENFWTLSVLEPIWDRLLAFDSTTQGVAQLVYKAHLRTLSVEGLRALLGGKDPKQLEGFYSQVAMMRSFQTNEGLTLLDGQDSFEAHQYSFAGLSEVLLQFGEQVSGALQVPLVRLFGQSPAGLNSTGDSDWKNYEDGIKKRQVRRLKSPLVHTLLPIIAQSRGIKLPPAFTLSFAPLRQMAHPEKVAAAQSVTTTVVSAVEAGLITNRGQALKELRQQSHYTGIWTNITDEEIEEAENEPPMGIPGAEGESDLGDPPGPLDDGFLPQGLPPSPGPPQRPALMRAANDDRRRAMRDAATVGIKVGAVAGFPVVIETAAGQPRWNGKLSPGHYGYFNGTLGMDGDAVDVMISGLPSADVDGPVFVIEQRKPDGDLNQHKVMVGYPSAAEAAADYLGVWSRASMGVCRQLSIDDLKLWLKERVPSAARLRAVS